LIVAAPAASRSRDGFRPDVEGLRGLAVLIVVLFHAGLAGVIGGFVGVDVFFVISGFLITGLLLRERERSGRIALLAFYARRARRLLPAAIVVLLVTLFASLNLVAPLDRAEVGLDGAAAALSIGNIRFALASGDYFATVSAPSPFLHFWSLAVEEQFYLVWPALILLAARGLHPRARVAFALIGIVATAFAINLFLTDVAPNWAFYSLPTRAWELGLGGLVAIASGAMARAPRGVTSSLGWLGLAGIGVATLTYDETLAYPGVAALVPSIGAAALLAGGTGRFGPNRILTLTPLRDLGKISYSLYLVHWPILVLTPYVIGGPLDGLTRFGLVGLSIGLSALSWALIETPFRTALPRFSRQPGRTVSIGLAAVLAVVVLAAGPSLELGGVHTATAAEQPVGSADPINEAWPGGDGPVHSPSDPSFPPSIPTATPAIPSDAPTPAPSATSRPTLKPDVARTGRLPVNVRPALADARSDEERLRRDGCLSYEMVTVPADCVYAVRDAAFTVALVGDSHAAQWFPAVERLAKHEGWRVVTFAKVACPFIDMRVRNVALKREYRECAAFNQATIERLGVLKPDLTLVSMSRIAIHPLSAADDTVAAKGAAVGRMLKRVPGRVALIVDTPYAGRDVPGCLSANQDDIDRCAIPRATAFTDDLGHLETEAARASGAGRIDLTRRICVGNPCSVVVNGLIVYRDIGHLTATYSRSLAPALDDAIAAFLDRSAG
jgi:peptidoglycan/LPS O-acetylase OafA/YrhL